MSKHKPLNFARADARLTALASDLTNASGGSPHPPSFSAC